jgi:tripartite-type tricarboxylate transporter receptor subunit TctC
MFDNLASSLPQHKGGNLKILAVCTPERSPHLPDVPTMSEAALPDFVSVAWFGLVAPPGTPDDIVEKLSKDVVAVLKTAEMRERFQKHAATPMGTTPQETAAFLERERKQWGEVIEKANLKR